MTFKQAKGFSLVSVLIAGSLLGMISYGTIRLMQQFTKGVHSTRSRAIRDQLFLELVRQSAAPATLQKSISMNGTSSYLGKCGSINSANDCIHNSFKPFDLYSLTSTKIAGTATGPVRYTMDAAQCVIAGPICPLEAITEFAGMCAGGGSGSPAACDQMTQLRVTVTLRQSPLVPDMGGNFQLKPQTMTNTVDLSAVLANGAQTCTSPDFMTGIDANGKIICTAPGVATERFGGAWACKLSGMSCGACLAANPLTGGCSCPAGYSTLKVTGCSKSLYRCGFICAK